MSVFMSTRPVACVDLGTRDADLLGKYRPIRQLTQAAHQPGELGVPEKADTLAPAPRVSALWAGCIEAVGDRRVKCAALCATSRLHAPRDEFRKLWWQCPCHIHVSNHADDDDRMFANSVSSQAGGELIQSLCDKFLPSS